MSVCCRIDKLSIDAHGIPGALDTALKHVAHAQFARDLPGINRLSLVAKGRIAGDHEQPGDLRQIRDRHAAIEARNDRGLTPLHAAAYGGHVDTAAALIEHGAAIDDNQNRYHTTPLIVAAEDGHTDVVRLLIDKGANIEAAEANGFTALSQAGAVEKWDTVDVLIKAGAICQPKEVAGEWWWKECNTRRK
jgi:ankyrin repeat protein